MTNTEYEIELQKELSERINIKDCKECRFFVKTKYSLQCIFNSRDIKKCYITKKYLNL